MIAMDDIRVEFNGVDLLATYNIGHVSVDGPQTHIFAGSKTIQTTSPIYRTRQILTSSVGEPLNFSLTFAPLDGDEWSDELINIFYRLFDVTDFKPLRFGSDEMYYNVLPYVGNISEMRLFAMSGGYVTIPFQCDAPHGWIDKEYHFKRSESTAGIPWHVDNPCNVKDALGTYRVYPYIILSNFESNDGFVSFGRSSEITSNIDEEHWYTLKNVPVNPATSEFHIDCYNEQVYDVGNESKVNLLNYMTDRLGNENLRFFYFEGGPEMIWHREIDGQASAAHYDMDIYMSCPYMK